MRNYTKLINEIIIILFFQFFSLFSFYTSIKNENSKRFDIPLIIQNNKLRQKIDYNSIIALNKKYLKLANEIPYEDGKAFCYINIAYIYTQTGNFKQAKSLLSMAKLIVDKSDNILLRASFFMEVESLNFFLDFPSRALDLNHKVIYYSKKIQDDNIKRIFLNKSFEAKGNIYFELGKHDSILYYYHKALKVENSSRTMAVIAQYHLWHTKKIDSAAQYISKALVNIKPTQVQTKDVSFIYFVAGTYNREIKNYRKSKKYYNAALRILEEKKNFSISYFHIYIYSDLMDIAKKEQDRESARYYFIAYSQARHTIEKQKGNISDIINEEFILEIKKNGKKDKMMIIIYFEIIFILFLLLYFILYKRIMHLKSKKQILEQETELLSNETKILKVEINDKRLNEVIELAKKNDSTFLMKFREVNPEFMKKLITINPNLENSELIFCAMLSLNFTSKEIANYMFILHDSVQKRKSRLRKKLSISSNVDLYHFLREL
ncbi:hypothetical protein CMU25_17270 [Elizabethkingia anophelis]|nr:hypothetical protein [Elizabethkingia anophelis]MDV3842074.1 hypothetical protein [Elizabethkingia anophelis]